MKSWVLVLSILMTLVITGPSVAEDLATIPNWAVWECGMTVVEDETFSHTECLDRDGNSTVKFTEEATQTVFMVGWGWREDEPRGIRVAILTNEGEWVTGDPGMGYLVAANLGGGTIEFRVFRTDGSLKARRVVPMPFKLIPYKGEPV